MLNLESRLEPIVCYAIEIPANGLDPEVEERWLANLYSDAERAKILAKRNRVDRARSLLGHQLLRHALDIFVRDHSDALENELSNAVLNSSDIFTRTEHGKLIFADAMLTKFPLLSRIAFNISHAGKWAVAALALGDGVHIGVDVVRDSLEEHSLHSCDQLSREMSSQLSQSEWDLVQVGGSSEQQLTTFHALWSLKEALVKAHGTGITRDLHYISFIPQHCEILNNNLDQLNPPSMCLMDGKMLENAHFSVQHFDQQDYIVSIALIGSTAKMSDSTIKRVEMEDLKH
ncbi:hypothetical protein GQ42DRAFT_77551 [Ramicandelaber brevisporus]|nr:hypothetical protein GQ42DRAFT_77551 [Ramicandelaber brevisporus]